MKCKGISCTVLSALLFGLTPVLAAQVLDLGGTPETLTFYRNLFALPVLAVFMLVRRDSFRINRKEAGMVILIGILGLGATVLMLYSSYSYVGIGTATTLHFLYPVFVALICRFLFKERLGLVKLAALAAASFGILFFIDWNQNAGMLGILLAAGSGLTYAAYMVGLDKTHLKDLSPYKVSFYFSLTVSLGMLLYNIPTQKIVFSLPPKALIYTAVIAVGTSFLAVVLLQVGIRYLNASTAAIFCLFEPVTSSIAGWLFLGEDFGFLKLCGSAVILAAVALLTVFRPEKTSKDNICEFEPEPVTPDSVLETSVS